MTHSTDPVPPAPGTSQELTAAHTSIAAALAGLAELENRPVVEHIEVFERVHAALTQALSRIDGA